MGAASEEASYIPFPPGRRKLYIRCLLLPFRKPTASLGRLSVNIRKERELPKPEVLFVPPSRQNKPAPFHFCLTAKVPHPQSPSSFPNCDRFTGSQFGFRGFRRAARDLDDGGQVARYEFCSAKIFSTAAGSSGREAMRAAASLTEPKPYSVKMNGIPAFAAASASPCVSPT